MAEFRYIQVRLSQEKYDDVKACAWRRHESMNKFCNVLLDTYIGAVLKENAKSTTTNEEE